MRFDRLPDGGILGVVVDDQDLVSRIVQRRQGVQRLDQKRGRLVVGGHVDGDDRQLLVGHRAQGERPTPPTQPQRLGPFVRLGHDQDDDAAPPDEQQDAHDGRGRRHVEPCVVVDDPDRCGRDGIHHQGEETFAFARQTRAVAVEKRQEQYGHDDRESGKLLPVRDAHHGLGEDELGLAIGVVDAPVGTGGPFELGLPGLVEGLHDIVDVTRLLGVRKKTAQETRLIRQRRLGPPIAPAVARPADLPDNDLLVRKCFLDLVVATDRIGYGLFDGNAFPIGQQVDGDEVHMIRKLRIFEPDMPRFGRAHG